VRDRLDEFRAQDAEVAVITFTRPRNLRGFRSRFVAPLTALADERRDVYEQYGLARPVDETQQLGGDFVIWPDARIARAYWSKAADDRPSVDDLLSAIMRP
jgi:peroxiredoxin